MQTSASQKAPVIPEKRIKELLLFQSENDLSFNDISLLNTAFTHSSYANEAKSHLISDNERLEFLGDSVLSISVSEYLYRNLGGDEGDCTRIRSQVVSEESLSKIAGSLKLDRYILMGKGEEQTGGRHKKAILADCMEAVFAAIYLDSGFENAKAFILKLLIPQINDVLDHKGSKDYKTLLQEYVQKRYKKIPTYTLVKREGPEHDQKFWCTVEYSNRKYGPISGHNKKEAEQNVAKLACEDLPV